MEFSLSITTFNRPELTVESFVKVLNDKRINDITVIDDHSDIGNWMRLQELMPKSEKIELYSNPENVGMAENKRRAISMAHNDWVIVLDSDNVIDADYLDAIDMPDLQSDTIYCPVFARPNFNYREFQGLIIDRDNVNSYCDNKNLYQLLNTCNYLVHKNTYLNNWRESRDIGECDTVWHAFNHFKADGKFYVVPDMHYEHRVHEGSAWLSNKKKNQEKFKEIRELIRYL